jgi:Fe-Mn family superoxide dismutase
MKFEEKKFNIGELKGISQKNIEEHLKLYAGYVKNTNELLESEEYNRRFPFEFNGMRNHEIYFTSLVGGPTPAPISGALAEVNWEKFKELALTRGVGWAILYYDPLSKQLIQSWVDEQHLGQLSQCIPILALDMWEHAYVYDYPTSEKKKYIETFFENLNWEVIEENFKKAL